MTFFGRSPNIQPLHNMNLDDMNPEFKQYYVNSNNINFNFDKLERCTTKLSQSELLMIKLQLFVLLFSQPLANSIIEPIKKHLA